MQNKENGRIKDEAIACKNPNLDAQFIPFSAKSSEEADKVLQTIKEENKSFTVDDTRRERIFTVQERCVSTRYALARARG